MFRQLVRRLCTSGREQVPRGGQFRSPWKILGDEMRSVREGQPLLEEPEVPREVDVLVVGGGLVGSSVAYWIKQRHAKGINVMVLEKDMSYTRASTMLSAGGLRHQFSLPENVQLSMFTSDFLRSIKEHLSVLDEDPPDVAFNHQGYLFLVPPEKVDLCLKNVKMQRELGAKIDTLSRTQLSEKFPWLNLEGVEMASYGLQGEGWFDPYSLVRAFKCKNLNLGVKYVAGELVDFEMAEHEVPQGMGEVARRVLKAAVIKGCDGKMYNTRFALVVDCAGAWAAEVAEKALIGVGDGDLATPLPIEPRKRYVYVLHCPEGPGLATPFTIDSSKAYFRQDGYGGCYLCGSSPSEEEEPDTTDLEVDYDYFQNTVWPCLANRVPKFENIKLKSAWAGYYDYNTLDQNLIIGNHPYHYNFFFANGLSGHGVQHAPAVGHALMELIVDSQYKTVDLSRFDFSRIVRGEPLFEEAIV